ncbi:MAG: pyridoxamine 5'-phosphate oxidase family protein [Myxococcota bacterium]
MPLRLATGTESSFPILCSLWFMYDAGRLICATQADAKVARALESDARCAFEISTNEMPYFGFRGRGSASLSRDGAEDALERLIDRYLGRRDSGLAKWLLSRANNEVQISIEIDWATSWDYSQRMSR